MRHVRHVIFQLSEATEPRKGQMGRMTKRDNGGF